MSLTPVGAVALLFASYALICRPAWTYFSAIFFMGFSGCAFVNVGSTFGLELSLFFFLCYALVLGWGRDSGSRVGYSKGQVAPLCLTLLLGLAVLVSLCRPALKGELLPISISVSVFTGVGLVLTWLTVAFVHSRDRVLTVLRVEFASVVFISGWGALQLACALLQLPYPSFIFNNSASHFALLYGAEASGGYVRVGSVAVEPSILVQSIAVPCSIAATLLTLGVPELRRCLNIDNGILWRSGPARAAVCRKAEARPGHCAVRRSADYRYCRRCSQPYRRDLRDQRREITILVVRTSL